MDIPKEYGAALVRDPDADERTARAASPSGQAKGGQNGPQTFHAKPSSGATLTPEDVKRKLEEIVKSTPLSCNAKRCDAMFLEANMLIARQPMQHHEALCEHLKALLYQRARGDTVDQDRATIVEPKPSDSKARSGSRESRKSRTIRHP